MVNIIIFAIIVGIKWALQNINQISKAEIGGFQVFLIIIDGLIVIGFVAGIVFIWRLRNITKFKDWFKPQTW